MTIYSELISYKERHIQGRKPLGKFFTLLLYQTARWHWCRNKCSLGIGVQTHFNLLPKPDLNSGRYLDMQ